MSRRLRPYILGFVTLLGLAGCSSYVTQERPAWRMQAENACLARGAVRDSRFMVSSREISGPGICGLTHPFKVTALADGAVTINSTQTLGCPMIEALDAWLKDVVQPAAQARFGEPVVRINSMGSYSCRGINNMSGASLSEHAFGNGIDIGGFVLASGRELNIMRGFNGPDEQESAFLHEVHAGACGVFTTVLGPGYNILHYNHFHLDLAMHGSTSRGMRRYCKPVPKSSLPEPPQRDNLPDPPAIEEEMDIARAPMPEPGVGPSGSSFVASLPAPPPTRAAAYTPVPPRTVAANPVTFAVDDPALEPEAVSRNTPRPAPREPRPRRLSPPLDPEQGMSAGAEPDAADMPMPVRSAPDSSRAADWDITSSTRR